MWFDNVGTFMEFGFQHILPQGMDHVLFVVALYLNARNWPSLFLQVTTFTLAHTITLGLASTGTRLEPRRDHRAADRHLDHRAGDRGDPLQSGTAWRLPVIFAFGLLHGLGFGSVMKVYLENADLSAGLIGITIGVELGHLSVLVATGLVAFPSSSPSRPRTARPLPPSLRHPRRRAIALVGLYWTLQRTGILPE